MMKPLDDLKGELCCMPDSHGESWYPEFLGFRFSFCQYSNSFKNFTMQRSNF